MATEYESVARIVKGFETSYNSADENMLCICWCLIKLQNFTMNHKSAYDQVKIKNRIVVSGGVISATESESVESERFHFRPTAYDSVAYVPLMI